MYLWWAGAFFTILTLVRNKKVLTEEKAIAFIEELLINVKFARHNLVWEQIDKPSQQIFGDAQSYEKFFDTIHRVSQEKAMSDFSIDKDNIMVRDNWISPQGVTYNNVYEIPVEKTLNNGETAQDTFCVFGVNGELKTASTLTKKQYNEAKQELIEGGYLVE